MILVFSAYGFPDRGMGAIFVAPIVWTVFSVGAASFVPAAIAIMVSEIFRLRSVFYFLLVGGAIGLAGHELARLMGMFIVDYTRPVAFPAAGFVGGFVYWLIAGMSAGPPPPAKADAPR